MKRYEYILKVEDGGLWVKVKEGIRSKEGDLQNLDIRCLANGNISLSFDSDSFDWDTYEIVKSAVLPDTYKKVIFCKCCKHYDRITGECNVDGVMRVREPYDFCSRAEREKQ